MTCFALLRALWFLGVLFTLLKGIWIKPCGLDPFDLDFLAIATAYIFLFYGQMGAGAFALGQGLFMDIFSGGLHGLCAALYLCVFVGIYLGSRFFNLQEPRGQIIIVVLSVLLKMMVFQAILGVFYRGSSISRSFLLLSAVSVIITGLITLVLIPGWKISTFRASRHIYITVVVYCYFMTGVIHRSTKVCRIYKTGSTDLICIYFCDKGIRPCLLCLILI